MSSCTYFEDLEQRSHELSEAEDATTAALRLSSRPPHRARHLFSGHQDKPGSFDKMLQASFIVYITRYDGFAVGV